MTNYISGRDIAHARTQKNLADHAKVQETRRYPASTRVLKTEVLGLKGALIQKSQYYASANKARSTRKCIHTDLLDIVRCERNN